MILFQKPKNLSNGNILARSFGVNRIKNSFISKLL